MRRLDGKRVLLVEDEALVAAMVADMLEGAGAAVLGPAGTLEAALALAETAAIDVAVLDMNLRGERIDAVADALAARGIPFVFATGYGASEAGRWPDAPIIGKPYAEAKLTRLLAEAMHDPAGAPPARPRVDST